jgi:hypothetical protein
MNVFIVFIKFILFYYLFICLLIYFFLLFIYLFISLFILFKYRVLITSPLYWLLDFFKERSYSIAGGA